VDNIFSIEEKIVLEAEELLKTDAYKLTLQTEKYQ
jgi:hypothetical protein